MGRPQNWVNMDPCTRRIATLGSDQFLCPEMSRLHCNPHRGETRMVAGQTGFFLHLRRGHHRWSPSNPDTITPGDPLGHRLPQATPEKVPR